MSFKATLAANVFYRIGNVAVLFATTIVLSRAMSVEGYGVLSLLVLNAALFNLLTSFGIDSGVAFSAASNLENRNRLAAMILVVVVLQMLLLLLADWICFVTTGNWWLNTGSQHSWWLAVLFLAGLSLQEKCAALLNGSHLYTACNKTIFFGNVIAVLILVFVSLVADSNNVAIYLRLYVLLNAAQALALALVSKRQLRLFVDIQFSKALWLPFLQYSFLVFVTNLVQFLAYRADLWMIDAFRHNKTELGWYALAVRLVQLLWILPVLFASIIFPKVSRAKDAYDQHEMLSLLRLLNGVNIVGGTVLFFLIKPLLLLLFGLPYAPAVQAFQLLLPGVVLFVNVTMIAAYFAGMNAVKRNLWGSLFCLVTTVALDLWLIPRYGHIGAAVASSVGYSLTALGYVTLYCRGQNVPVTQLFVPQKKDWEQVRALGKNFLKRS